MRATLPLLLSLTLAPPLAGCRDRQDPPRTDGGTDGGGTDGGGTDGGGTDGGGTDGGGTDGGGTDGGGTDGGGTDGGGTDGGGTDGGGTDGGGTPSEQIAAVRAAESTPPAPLAVSGALVTYVVPAVGDDPAGFTLQADATGPALLVAVDPATLTPVAEVGQTVSLEVTDVAVVEDQHRVTAISGWSVSATGGDASALAQDLSAAADVVTGLDGYESELAVVTGTLTGAAGYAGAAHSSMELVTAGLTSPDLLFRAPDSVFAASGLSAGCQIEVGPTPLWRFRGDAQVSAWVEGDVEVLSCPAPVVLRAVAVDDIHVDVHFDRALDPATATVGRFTFDGGLTASSVAVSGSVVTVTTSAMTRGVTYEVTVAAEVTDLFGVAVDPAADTATFVAVGAVVAPSEAGDVVITELFTNAAGSDDGKEWIELWNPSGTEYVQLYGCTLEDDGGSVQTLSDTVLLGPSGYVVLGGAESEADPAHDLELRLGNTEDAVTVSCGGVAIDAVAYDATFGAAEDATMSLDVGHLSAIDNDLAASWCTASGSTVYGTAGRLGTPGAANPACGGSGTGVPPAAGGDLVITEILDDPVGDEAVYEWFEVHNPSASVTYNLAGCLFEDDNASPDSFEVLGDLLVGPGEYLTFAVSADPGFVPDYVYARSDLALANGDDELQLFCGGTLIDEVVYDDGLPAPNGWDNDAGKAMSLSAAALDAASNDAASSWCMTPEATPYVGADASTWNYGTPGAANAVCP